MRAQLCNLAAQLLEIGLEAIETRIFCLNSQSCRFGIECLGVGDRFCLGNPGNQVGVARLLAAGLPR